VLPASVAPQQSEKVLAEITQTTVKSVASTDNTHGFTLQVYRSELHTKPDNFYFRLAWKCRLIFYAWNHQLMPFTQNGHIQKQLLPLILVLPCAILIRTSSFSLGWRKHILLACGSRSTIPAITHQWYFIILYTILLTILQLSFHPQFEVESQRETDLLILLDRSCSMEGDAIQDLRRILRALVSNLPAVVSCSLHSLYPYSH
jgi:hypothetical protein